MKKKRNKLAEALYKLVDDLFKKKTKQYKGEMGELHTIEYSTKIGVDGVMRCAWCNKKNPSKKHIDNHEKL